MTTRAQAVNATRQRGVGLIEVLITVLVLAVGLLGLAALQTSGARYSHSAYLSTQATLLSQDLIERMRANRGNLQAYTLALGATPGGGSSVAAVDLTEWWGNVGEVLPVQEAGLGAGVAVNGDRVTVTLRWLDARWLDPDESDEDERIRTFVVETQL